MPVQLGAKPSPDFDHPIDLIVDCHRRIEHFFEVLHVVTESGKGGPLSPSYRHALQTALQFFRQSIAWHHADEEQSVFSRLRSCGDARVAQTLEILRPLEEEHAAEDSKHREVDDLGARWLANDHLDAADAARLLELVEFLRAAYHRHIQIEDTQVFPLAGQCLSRDSLRQIGDEMAARRGVKRDIGQVRA